MKNLKAAAIVVFVLTLLAFCPLSAFANDVGDAIESNYTVTENLTNADKDDLYQKNYQKDASSTDDAYLYKTAEWTDKANGEAMVTVTCHFAADLPPETTAVYALTICTAHKFTKEKAIANIEYLLDNYDHLDIVLATSHQPSGVVILEDVKSADFLDDYVFKSNKHWSLIVYEGLYDYLTGATPGKETGSEEQQRFPDFIYTSFDSRIVRNSQESGNGEANLSNYDLGTILKAYDDAGCYCSLSGCGRGDTAELSFYTTTAHCTDEILKTNCIACLMDPQSWQGLSQSKRTYWDGTKTLSLDTKIACHASDDHVTNPLNGERLRSDYSYDQTFQYHKVPTVYDITISDTIDSHFDIVDYAFSSTYGEVSVNDNTVTVSMDCIEVDPMVLTMNIKLKDSVESDYLEDWECTNVDVATATMYKNDTLSKALSVESPVLCIPKELFVQHHFFVSGVEGVELPDEIKNRIPADVTGLHDKEIVSPSEFDTTPVRGVVNGKGGQWVYRNWDEDSKTVNKADVDFVGVWDFVADENDEPGGPSDEPGNGEPGENPNNGTTPHDVVPNTGDSFGLGQFALLAALVCAAAAVLGASVLRRRRVE